MAPNLQRCLTNTPNRFSHVEPAFPFSHTPWNSPYEFSDTHTRGECKLQGYATKKNWVMSLISLTLNTARFIFWSSLFTHFNISLSTLCGLFVGFFLNFFGALFRRFVSFRHLSGGDWSEKRSLRHCCVEVNRKICMLTLSVGFSGSKVLKLSLNWYAIVYFCEWIWMCLYW